MFARKTQPFFFCVSCKKEKGGKNMESRRRIITLYRGFLLTLVMVMATVKRAIKSTRRYRSKKIF